MTISNIPDHNNNDPLNLLIRLNVINYCLHYFVHYLKLLCNLSIYVLTRQHTLNGSSNGAHGQVIL